MEISQFSQTLEAVYAAASDWRRWPEALDSVRELVPAAAAAFIGFDGDKRPKVLFRSGADARFFAELQEAFLDSALPLKTLSNGRKQETVFDAVPGDESETGRHEFHKWLGGFGLRFTITGYLHDESCGDGWIMLFRAADQGAFSDADIAAFRAIRPHLERALRICRREYEALVYRETAWDLMDGSPHGIILFDHTLHVLRLNAEARRIVDQADGLELKESRLVAASPADNSRMAGLLRQAATSAGDGSETLEKGAVIINRPSGHMPIIGTVMSAHTSRTSMPCKAPAALLFVRDLVHRQEPSVAAFSNAFRLTPAESRLAETYARGRTLGDHARAEGISEETVRWHLKNILSKTNCRSQMQLLNLIRRSAMPRV